jgi:uncharacterized protein YecE (DUF72 family)
VNGTFYRLARPAAVARWVAQTPPTFLFAVKGSRYLTHMKRLAGTEPGVRRFYEAIAPLAASPKLGPVLWQLPEAFRRDDARLRGFLESLPPGRHCVELRHESWFCGPVYALLHELGVALALGDHPDRPWVPRDVMTADWTLLRFHAGRDFDGAYGEMELRAWADRIRALRASTEVFAYFNNDWRAHAPRNATRLRELLGD